MLSTISPASASMSAITSWMTVRTIRLLSRASVVEADQTVLRLSASAARDGEGISRRGVVAASCSAIFALNIGDLQQRPVPARLQFRCHQAVGGIGRIILAEC